VHAKLPEFLKRTTLSSQLLATMQRFLKFVSSIAIQAQMEIPLLAAGPADSGFFNDAIFICRHLADSIITMGRKSKFHLAADGTLTKTEPTEAQRKASLIEEFALSEEIVEKLHPTSPQASHLLACNTRQLSPTVEVTSANE
jgi:hypothetical protein